MAHPDPIRRLSELRMLERPEDISEFTQLLDEVRGRADETSLRELMAVFTDTTQNETAMQLLLPVVEAFPAALRVRALIDAGPRMRDDAWLWVRVLLLDMLEEPETRALLEAQLGTLHVPNAVALRAVAGSLARLDHPARAAAEHVSLTAASPIPTPDLIRRLREIANMETAAQSEEFLATMIEVVHRAEPAFVDSLLQILDDGTENHDYMSELLRSIEMYYPPSVVVPALFRNLRPMVERAPESTGYLHWRVLNREEPAGDDLYVAALEHLDDADRARVRPLFDDFRPQFPDRFARVRELLGIPARE